MLRRPAWEGSSERPSPGVGVRLPLGRRAGAGAGWRPGRGSEAVVARGAGGQRFSAAPRASALWSSPCPSVSWQRRGLCAPWRVLASRQSWPSAGCAGAMWGSPGSNPGPVREVTPGPKLRRRPILPVCSLQREEEEGSRRARNAEEKAEEFRRAQDQAPAEEVCPEDGE